MVLLVWAKAGELNTLPLTSNGLDKAQGLRLRHGGGFVVTTDKSRNPRCSQDQLPSLVVEHHLDQEHPRVLLGTRAFWRNNPTKCGPAAGAVDTPL